MIHRGLFLTTVYAIALAVLSLSGCFGSFGKQEASGESSSGTRGVERSFRRKPDGRYIAVWLGPAWNSRRDILDDLHAEFGQFAEGGAVLAVNTMEEVRGVSPVRILVTVAVPERSVRELERLRASDPEIQILSVFPMDEVLPVEAVSDLVLDLPAASDILSGEAEDTAFNFPSTELSSLLYVSVLALESESAPAPDRFSSALKLAREASRNQSVGSSWTVSAWKDPDTGIRSRNHLVIAMNGSGDAR